ncbi:hypothetical protein SNEBB_002748 [Seison nebaliae]|nr:hypothetical protein SNEBB_002748 [Seison nebaliae]
MDWNTFNICSPDRRQFKFTIYDTNECNEDSKGVVRHYPKYEEIDKDDVQIFDGLFCGLTSRLNFILTDNETESTQNSLTIFESSGRCAVSKEINRLVYTLHAIDDHSHPDDEQLSMDVVEIFNFLQRISNQFRNLDELFDITLPFINNEYEVDVSRVVKSQELVKFEELSNIFKMDLGQIYLSFFILDNKENVQIYNDVHESKLEERMAAVYYWKKRSELLKRNEKISDRLPKRMEIFTFNHPSTSLNHFQYLTICCNRYVVILQLMIDDERMEENVKLLTNLWLHSLNIFGKLDLLYHQINDDNESNSTIFDMSLNSTNSGNNIQFFIIEDRCRIKGSCIFFGNDTNEEKLFIKRCWKSYKKLRYNLTKIKFLRFRILKVDYALIQIKNVKDQLFITSFTSVL